MAYTFLVLLGCLLTNNEAYRYGMGFIVEYKNQLFVVSCKHVFETLPNKNSIFIIPNPRQSISQKFSINLGEVYFHPDDNKDFTFDIAVYKLLEYDKSTLLSKGIIPLKIQNNYKSKYNNTTKLFSAGFPAKYTDIYFAKNNGNIIPPKIVEGNLFTPAVDKTYIVGKETGEGYKEKRYIRTKNGERLGEGVSGGLVFIKDESNSIYPIGLLSGEGDYEINFPNGTKEKLYCLVYIKIERVIEVLDNIH